MTMIPQATCEKIQPDGHYVFAFSGGPSYTGHVGGIWVVAGVAECSGNQLYCGPIQAGQAFPFTPGAQLSWDGKAWSYTLPVPVAPPAPVAPVEPVEAMPEPSSEIVKRGPGRPRKVIQ